MKKISRPIILLFIFVLLFSANSVLVYSYYGGVQRSSAAEMILSEIGDANPKPDEQFFQSANHMVVGEITGNFQLGDARAANLRRFFGKYDSVLYDFADLIVEEADRNGFDYRLLAAIAMQESNLCAKIPAESHNCWGWGITATSTLKFDSYDESIRTVSKGLKKYYIDKGYDTASKVMKKYTPHSKGSWARAVNHFMQSLEE